MSVRSLTRCGQTVSFFDMAMLGSSLSVRSFVRLGSGIRTGPTTPAASYPNTGVHLQDDIVVEKGKFMYFEGSAAATGDTKLGFTDANGLQLQVDNTNKLTVKTVSGTGGNFVQGTLHGVWVSDVPVTTSDARMKKDITNLDTTLSVEMPDSARAQNETSSSWVLRELRPVSFRLKKGSESKNLRYGFIAQEIEKVLPPVVRDTAERKGVLYQDLIAVLTLTAQQQEKRIIDLEKEIKVLQKRVGVLEKNVPIWNKDEGEEREGEEYPENSREDSQREKSDQTSQTSESETRIV